MQQLHLMPMQEQVTEVAMLRLLLLGFLLSLLTGCAIQPSYSPQAQGNNTADSTSGTAATHAPESSVVPGRYIVVYRENHIPVEASEQTTAAGGKLASRFDRFGLSIVEAPGEADATAIRRLSAMPNVAAVLHDRYVSAHDLGVVPAPGQTKPPTPAPVSPPAADTDALYISPQGWAVRQAGGYGANVPGGPSSGPWNYSMGAGIRIAILDTGIDWNHPDIAPNLALNISDVDSAALPSPCDDGSPQDQQGHGTWAASLAAGALGPGTGRVIGVAPQATLLNIKVLQRMPAVKGPTLAAQCAAGQGGGLLSWVLQGMNDAVANKADIVSLSLGSILDLSTGDGAGWKATFDRVTHAASSAGVVIVAAVGNDSLDLSGRYVELPAQARDVLPVVASTNAACAEDLAPGAVCVPGPVTRPYYSNFGVTGALAAPGGSYPNPTETGISGWVRGACSSGVPGTTDGLPSTGSSFGCFNLGHTAYVQAMGTSASAPLAAGVAALLRSAHPGWSAAQTISALRATATATSSMTEPQVNAAAALALP